MNKLVPTTGYRRAHNLIYGQDTREHNDQYTAEQATRIAEHFAIDVYLGTHGNPSEGETIQELSAHPTQGDYDNAAAAVEDLERGDVLFVEGRDFDYLWEELTSEEKQDFFNADYAAHGVVVPEGVKPYEAARDQHKIDAWTYAMALAEDKGVEIVFADMDSFDTASMAAATGYDTMGNFDDMKEGDSRLFNDYHMLRAKKARNIMKDYALARLAGEEANPQKSQERPARKTKLRLLFGIGHTDDFAQVFDDQGLPVTIHKMRSSSKEERIKEEAEYRDPTLRGKVSMMMAQIAMKHPDATLDYLKKQVEAAEARKKALGGKTAGGPLGQYNILK